MMVKLAVLGVVAAAAIGSQVQRPARLCSIPLLKVESPSFSSNMPVIDSRKYPVRDQMLAQVPAPPCESWPGEGSFESVAPKPVPADDAVAQANLSDEVVNAARMRLKR